MPQESPSILTSDELSAGVPAGLHIRKGFFMRVPHPAFLRRGGGFVRPKHLRSNGESGGDNSMLTTPLSHSSVTYVLAMPHS